MGEAAGAESTDRLRERGESLRRSLVGGGVSIVTGFATNGSNLVHAKAMPVARTPEFVASGAGISPVYNGYSLDGSIQFTPHYGPVGDLRMRLDPDSVRVLGGGLALGSVDVVTQDGEVDPTSARGILQRVCRDLETEGLEARVGHELEFVLVAADGLALRSGTWTPYGLGPILDHQLFLEELAGACARAGIPLEQMHAEYGLEQFEVSLPPTDPVAAADASVVVKALIGQVARRSSLAASFSPVPFPGAVGSGAHQHLSLRRDGRDLFADLSPTAPADGRSALAGILAHLKQAQGVLTGSVLSGLRLLPGMWSGASICWGMENREASVRTLHAGPANPHGANIEVKVIDPSANPYLATAVLLGLAAHGMREQLPLADETTTDPSILTDSERTAAGIDVLERNQVAVLDALDASALVRRILGDPAVDAILAVRRHEHDAFDGVPDDTAERLRLAWTL